MTSSAKLRSGKGSRDENFPVASILIKRRHRPVILAFYEFVRVADDIADHLSLGPDEKLRRLDRLEQSLLGQAQDDAEGVKLAVLLRERGLPARHAQDLLEAFRQDVTKLRYSDWNELIDYCSRSAMPVGRFVLDVHGEARSTWAANDALCAALQIINHLQDCGDDYRKLDRVYIPLDFLVASGIGVDALAQPKASAPLRACLHAVAARTSALLLESCGLAESVRDTGLAIEIAGIQSLARRLLELLHQRDPLSERVHLGKVEALVMAASGAARALTQRWLGAAASARRYQTP